MQWGNPDLLWLCLAALPLLFCVHAGRRGLRRVGEGLRGGGDRPPAPSGAGLTLVFCFLLVCFALAGPRFGAEPADTVLRAGDLVVVLDVSKSMQTEDLGRSRLEAAKKALSASLTQLKGERVALVAFAGSAFVVCPLTTDYALFEQVLATVGEEAIPLPGSSLAAALDEARRAFTKGEGERMVVLLSDGEDHAGEFLPAARALSRTGSGFLAVPVGTAAGGLVPLPGGDFLKKGEGAVLSRLRAQSLRETAAAAKGRVVGLAGLPEAVGEWSQGVAGSRRESRPRPRERFQFPLALALSLLLLEPLLALRSSR